MNSGPRYWFWHIIALAVLVYRDPSERPISDEDYGWYNSFMRSKGFWRP